jgi:transcriptional regulator with XRE-family HTH domain
MNGRFYQNEKILELRARKGLNRLDLAKTLKITLMHVYRIESGASCSEDLLWEIAQLFEVSFRSLIRPIPLAQREKEDAA